MKTKHIFWGLLFVSIGILILLKDIGLLYIDLSNIWRFWPVVIILWGISYFTKNQIVKGFIAGISGLILAVTLFAFFNSSYNFICNAFSLNDDDINFTINDSKDTSSYSEAFDPAIKNGEFHLNAGAGSFIINDSSRSFPKRTMSAAGRARQIWSHRSRMSAAPRSRSGAVSGAL